MELGVLPPRRPGRPFDSPCCGRGPLVSILAKGQCGAQVSTDKKEKKEVTITLHSSEKEPIYPTVQGSLGER